MGVVDAVTSLFRGPPPAGRPATLEQYAEWAIAFACSTEEVTRRAAAKERWCMLNDAWGSLLCERIRDVHHPEVAAVMLGDPGHERPNISRNPLKTIVEELAVLYDAPAERTTDPPEDGEAYRALCGPLFHAFWKHVDRQARGFNKVLLHPRVIDGAIKHACYTPDQVTMIPKAGDPTEAEAVVIVDEYVPLGGDAVSGRRTRFVLWHPEWHAAYDATGSPGSVLGTARRVDTDGDANPYGMVPFVPVSLYPFEEQLWPSTQNDDLVCTTMNLGHNGTHKQFLRTVHGFKFVMAVGRKINRAPQQIVNPLAVTKVEGDDVRATVESWEIDFAQLDNADDREEQRAAAAVGLNPARLRRADYQTAAAARLGDRGLAERRAEAAVIYRPAEQAYYRLVATIAQRLRLAHRPDPEATLTVVHATQDYPEDPAKQLAKDKEGVALGLTSLAAIVKRDRPELTDEQAHQFVMDNLEELAEVLEMKASRQIPNNPANRSAEDEQAGATAGRPPNDEGDDG